MGIRQLAAEVRGKQGREVFKDVLVDVGLKHEDVVVVGVDSFRSLRALDFEREFPDRSFNVGIAEQNAVGIAAGLALCGKLPVLLLFGFTIARALEQIRSTICYPNLGVRIVTNATGLDMGEGGVTHHCTEDVGFLRAVANITIVQAASGLETVFATHAIVEQVTGPVYLRLTRQTYAQEAEDATERYYGSRREFRVGEGVVLREGKDIALVGSGLTVGLALKAAAILKAQDISTLVLNMHTIKPLDARTILEIADRIRYFITLEDHNVIGGLGEAVSGVLARHGKAKILRVGIDDVFCEIGTPSELYEYYGLCPRTIAEQAKAFLEE